MLSTRHSRFLYSQVSGYGDSRLTQNYIEEKLRVISEHLSYEVTHRITVTETLLDSASILVRRYHAVSWKAGLKR